MIDPALLRPGRFDKLVLVGKPNEKARLNILNVHTRKMPLKDVDLEYIASKTDGYVGADLAALCREAGLNAYRNDKDSEFVTMDDFEAALQKVVPSVDSNMFANYDKIGKDLNKRRSGWDNVPFYG